MAEIDLTLPAALDRRRKVVPKRTGRSPSSKRRRALLLRRPAGPGLGSPELPTKDTNAIVAAGLKAWKQLKANTHKTWDDWILVGKALHVGRQEAIARTGMPPGHKLCNDAFSLWLKQHQDLADFNIIDKKSCRARLLWIIDNLDKIERWRATRSVSERAAWNSPSTTYRVAHCKQRGLPDFRDPTSSEQKNGKADEALPGSWSKLLVIADEACAYEKVKKRMPAEMAEPGNVQTIRDGGKALLAIADQLEKMSKPRVNVKDRAVEHVAAE